MRLLRAGTVGTALLLFITTVIAKEHHTSGNMQEVYTYSPNDVLHRTSVKTQSTSNHPSGFLKEF